MNTIEQDPDFLAFLKSLEEDNEAKAAASSVATGETQLEKLERTLLADQVAKEQGVAHSTVTSIVTASSSQLAGPDKPKSTPLLDALRAKKAASRAEGSKQTKAVTDAKGKESRRSEKKKSSSKSKEGGKSGSTSGMTKSVVPTGIVKRSSSPVGKKSATTPSASGASSKEATDVTPKAEQRRSRLAPTGGLFKASLGAVLGAKETKRPRGSARKQKADEDSQNDASASGDTAPEARASNGPGLQEREESKGRGYRQKRRTRLEGDLIDASADGVTAVINEGDTDTRKSKPRQVRSRDNTGTTDLSKPAEAWPEKDDSRKMSRNRVASTSSTSSMASQPPKRTGPSVTIMKRDGTTSSFNVGKNDAT
ncbi:uncharacterized protein SPPG_02174 [Spizellomyces punctatus DAOM BR117]|nr:uncharacterized protein SPPG_02174 [Spizellomyces punctatus DAOM BR117]KND03113.1 hypothetical protein SPPG_02174 [Spizellomyces punctatus DAOM BR117]|eukprot:XP_016611152.1 hypothetical protein SPPG_02174 [Spizellomyces punctatus DAOM BR117]